MRLLLVNNLFQPEPNHLKGLEFAKALVRRGHEVEVLTGFPNYPGGRIYPGYRVHWTARETLEGIPVTRVAMYPSHDRSGARRVLNYVSIGLSQALHALVLGRRFDLCHVYLGPITLLWPALVLRWLRGTRIVADVQDLWPESVTDSGMLRSRAAARILSAVCRRSHAAADRLIALSPGYRRALEAQGVPGERIEVIYNWCHERALSAGKPSPYLSPSVVNVVYAGNLGRLQGIDTILDAASRMRSEPGIRFILAGDGVDSERLRARADKEGLSNVSFTGRLTLQAASELQQGADVLLVHLQPTPLARIGVPQKVQAYMASGRPILAAAEGDAAELVQKAQCGMVCRPNDAEAMVRGIRDLINLGPTGRATLGASGRNFYDSHLSFEHGVARVDALFRSLADEVPAGT